MNDKAHREPQEPVHLTHPLTITFGQVIVDRDDVHTFAGQGVEVGGQSSHQCLTLTGLHLCDAPLMQNNATDELYPVWLHT